MASKSPSNTGISVVYEPEGSAAPIVELVNHTPEMPPEILLLTTASSFVFVHGLQGHPRGTWTKTNVGEGVRVSTAPPISEVKSSLDEKRAKRNSLRSVSKLFRRRSQNPDHVTPGPSTDSPADPDLVTRQNAALLIRHATNASTSARVISSDVFWPADLLPQICPCARILVFGYDSKITNYGASSTNKNSIYSHAKDLLFALSRATELTGGAPGRPIIFVAHSLGGIVVKEVSTCATQLPHMF